jgi:hypothetical protein
MQSVHAVHAVAVHAVVVMPAHVSVQFVKIHTSIFALVTLYGLSCESLGECESASVPVHAVAVHAVVGESMQL